MAGELLLLLLFVQSFLLSASSHHDSASLPIDCLALDLDDLDGYLATLNLTEVPSVEAMVAGFHCPITALPFGYLKSDWSRLLLLYEAQTTDAEFKEKLKRLFRVLVIAFHRLQERLVPTRGMDSSTIAGQFSTVSYSLATTREEVMKNSTNFVEVDGSTTDANTELYESSIKDNVTSLDGWNSSLDNVSFTEFYSTAGNMNNESSNLYGKLSTGAINVENNENVVSTTPDESLSEFFVTTQDNPVSTTDKEFSEVSEESTTTLDISDTVLHSYEENEKYSTEESPGSTEKCLLESSETTMEDSVAIFVTRERIPEDVSEVTKSGKTIAKDEDAAGNRGGEGNSRETKYDNATSGADNVSVSTAAEAVSNSVSAGIENRRGDGADFYSKDRAILKTSFPYSSTYTPDLLNNSQTEVSMITEDERVNDSDMSLSTIVQNNVRDESYATESENESSTTDNDIETTFTDNKMNEGNNESKESYGTEATVYAVDSFPTTRFLSSLKQEEDVGTKSVEYLTTTTDFQDADRSVYSSGNSSTDVIKTTVSSWIEKDTTEIPGMNNSIATGPGKLGGQQISEGKVIGFEESTLKSDRITPTARTTIAGQDAASSFKYPVMHFPDPSLNSVYTIIRHEKDFLDPVLIGPDNNGSYQPTEHKIKKPQIVKRPPPENPFLKFTRIPATSTSWRDRTSGPEVAAGKDERISLMGSKKRQSFDNNAENQYKWFYKVVGQDGKHNRSEDAEAQDNAKVWCKHRG